MITFEEYIQGLKELQAEYEQKASSARQSSLILDRIIENAKIEKAQLVIDLNNYTKQITKYQKQAEQDNKFIVNVNDLRKALAKVYNVKLGDASVNINLWSKHQDDELHGAVSIVHKGKPSYVYYISVDESTEFTDGAKLVENLGLKEISMARIDYDLANGRKVKDLNVNISLTDTYMDEPKFVEALRICFKNQQQSKGTLINR